MITVQPTIFDHTLWFLLFVWLGYQIGQEVRRFK